MKNLSIKILAFFALIAALFFLYPKFKDIQERLPFKSQGGISISSAKDTDFTRAELFKQTLNYLTRNYYDTKALEPLPLLREAMLGVSRSVPEILVNFPEGASQLTVDVEASKKEFSIPSLKSMDDILPVVQKVFAFIQANYHGEVKFEDMQYAAINGLLDALDPHSSLLPPKIFTEFKTQTEGEFGGIGIVIGLKDGEITVIAPLPDTPAGRAGLQPKDKIIQIGEEASINMDLSEAVERLRGKIGTKVSITVAREGAEAPLQFTLTRANIKIESVQSKLLSDASGDVGVLRVKSFQEETMTELLDHLRRMKSRSRNFRGLILDLRNNPGGLLNQAIDMANQFLEQGTIVLTVGANNQILEEDKADGFQKEENYPIVVVVNDGSASASEIVSGALKNNNRAVVIGTQTFGKGSVQSVYSMKDNSALKITVAQYLTPGNQSIQSVGITPDVKLMPKAVEKEKVDLIESDNFGEKDLKKHLESTFKKSSQPVYALGYYQAPSDKSEEAQNYSGEIELKSDFALQFAQQILKTVTESRRDKMLEEIKPLVETTRAAEEKKLADALQAIGVDWSSDPAPSHGKPKAEVTLNISSSQGQVLPAGEEAKMELKIHNTGQAPFYQLIASTDSENLLLKNREFIFGKIDPDQTKSWVVPIKAPAASFRRQDKVTFSFQEGQGNAPEKFDSMLVTQALAPPSYAYSYDLYDNGEFGSKGNGNGKVEPGEKIAIRVKVKNQGPGLSKKTVVNLKNLDGEGIFVSQGRQKLDELAVGAQKEALLGFSVANSFPKKRLELEMSISDLETLESLTDKFAFSMNGVEDIPRAGVLEAPPEILLNTHPFPTRTHDKKIQVSGLLKDESGLKDVSIYVGDSKNYLKSFPDPILETPTSTSESGGDKNYLKSFSPAASGKSVRESPFSAELALKEKENNLVTILARDKNNLTTRKSFFIYQE